MSRKNTLRIADYLQHILDAIENINTYTADMDVTAFKADSKTFDAVIRNFEVIGEACNNLVKDHPQFAAAHASVPWGVAYEMRNALSHGYFNVDLDVVWRTSRQDLPTLQKQIATLVSSADLTPGG